MKPIRTHPVVLLTAVMQLWAGGSLAAATAATQAPSDGEINLALRERDYARAAALIDAALEKADRPDREFHLFRLGLVHLYDGRPEAAIEQFAAQLKAFPDGPWSRKARFRTADAHVAMRQFAEAESIYAAEVRRLVGDERKVEIASVYLDFAEDYFYSADSLTQPDYAKARTFYERALELEPGPAQRDDLLYKRALCSRKLDQWADAAAQFEAYLLEFDPDYRSLRKATTGDAPLPEESKPGKYLIDARFALGECRLGMQQHAEARRAWQDLLTILGRIDPDKKQHRQTWIKTYYQLSKTHQLPTPPSNEVLALGVQTLEQLITAFPAAPEATQAAHDIAAAYAHLGRNDEAIAAFRALIDRKHIRPDDADARNLAEKLAQDALFRIGQLLFAQKKYSDAIGPWNQYVAQYPSGPQWSSAQQSIINAEYQIGADAQADERYDAAREAWTAFLQKHPLDHRVQSILLAFGMMDYADQEKRDKGGDPPDWQAPIAQWRKLVEKYPNTEESGLAQFWIAKTLEDKLSDLEAAIAAYKKLTWSQYAAQAQQRIAEMQAVRLIVLTERTFRSGQTAKVRADVRNIDKLTVKLYRIDLESYFRKRHGIRGVESLDLLLIDPDQAFEVEVPGYAKYRPITHEIELPFDDPGVWAVNISNEKSTAPERDQVPQTRLEATTLVIRSDIDIIVRSSRSQMLVFAQDMKAIAPTEGVRVLASDGQKVVFEGVTGPDGVWLSKSKKIKDIENLAVFAIRDGHVAGNALTLSGLGLSSGLQPRGYIHTDRPAYRPGDGVHIRGLLREVRGGSYALPTQPEDERLRWKLDVIDPKGRVLHTGELSLTDFGSFADSFRIAEDAPVGPYKLIARRPEGPTFTGGFNVQTYQLAQAYLSFDFDARVLMRGSKITGAVVAKYHYGEPVRGKVIEYEMLTPTGDRIRRTGTTDADGRVAFEFESTMMSEEGTVDFTARQADLDIAAADQVFVAIRAFRAEVAAARPLYLSEEPVEVTVTTRDLKAEPIANPMTLMASLRTYANNQWAETRVETAELNADAKSGKARTSLRLTKGGTYVLRAEGKDRFGHVVSAESTVQVSDDQDQTRLRLFSDREHYKVGEQIALDIHSRIYPEQASPPRVGQASPPKVGQASLPASPAPHAPSNKPASQSGAIGDSAKLLALVTWDGEGVISHRTITLTKGHNPLEFSVQHEHFPNFAVSVAVMAGNRFFEASRAFSVERELHVAIKPDKKTYRPRDEMTVDLTVTDQQGRPVEAELCLSMIDNALLARYPDETPDIVRFFQEGASRQTLTRTTTSCTFAYSATTRPMVTEVLDEEDLLAEARDEEERLASVEGGLIAVAGAANEPAPAVDMYTILRQASADAFAQPGAAPDSVIVAGPEFRGRGINLPASQVPSKSAAESRLIITGGREGGIGGGRFVGPVSTDAAGLTFTYLDKKAMAADQFVAGEELRRRTYFIGLHNLRDRLISIPPPGGQVEFDALLNKLAAEAPPRSYFPEVAYWNPRVVTDKNGKGTVRIVVPDSSTTWRLIARGATRETLTGQATTEVLSKHDFVVELLAPLTVMQGDAFRPRAQVHCLTPYKGEINVELKWRSGDGEARSQKKTITADGAGVHDVEFDQVGVGSADKLHLACSAETAQPVPDAKRKLADAAARDIPVRPWGMRIETHAAGAAADSEFVEIDLPPDKIPGGEVHDLRLTVAVGSSMQRWLIEEALESGPRWEAIDAGLANWRVAPPRTHADTASFLLGALYAADYVRSQQAGVPGPDVPAADQSADLRLLDGRAAGLIAQLLSAQNDDGGWAWCGRGGESNAWATSLAAWALGKARRDAHPVADDAVAKLVTYLNKGFSDAQPSQTELKSLLLHGLAWIDTADFGHANRLYRNRQSLSTAALAHLALTFVQLDRKSIAQELLITLDARRKEVQLNGRRCFKLPSRDCSEWMRSELEITALALLAQLQVDPRATHVKPLVDYLAGRARADGWRPHKAKGPVLAALATYYGRAEHERADYRLAVTINGQTHREITSDQAGSIRIDLAGDALQPGKQRIDFQFDGRGEYAYAVTLSGFARRFPKPEDVKTGLVRMDHRRIFPPPLEYHGRVVPAGFSVAHHYESFFNTARNVPVGNVVDVNVSLWRYGRWENQAGDRDYLIVQEHIPAGFRLLTDSVAGEHLAYDYANHVLTLYVGSKPYPGTIRYKMVAATPGTFRLAPTIVRSLYRPEIYHLNLSDTVVSVLPRDEKSPDPYRMTPDELFHLGRLHFDDAQYEHAAAFLEKLIGESWILRDEPYREAIRMLLSCALKRDDAEAMVNYFEILKEKHPDLVIPFADIVKVADAYARTDQHERAYFIYHATADASFVRDTAVGGVLEEEGRFLESIDFLEDLWRTYPDTPQVQSVYYAISQNLYAKAADPKSVRPRRIASARRNAGDRTVASGGPAGRRTADSVPTARPSEKHLSRADILLESARLLESFLALYPQSPVADEATYSLANVILDLDDYDRVVALSKRSAELFPDSKWLDRFRYMQALAHFHLGRSDDALALARIVVEATYRDDQGVMRPSPNKWLALYIIGQIYHARQDAAKAIEYYKKVKTHFSDAAEAVGYFEHRFIKLPEVTIFHPDKDGYRESEEWAAQLRRGPNGKIDSMAAQIGADPAPSHLYHAPFVEIDSRNIASVVLPVYRVDLMKLALVEKNLNEISSVDLSGIKPILEATVKFGDGRDYVDKSRRVFLDLRAEKRPADAEPADTDPVDGAYLIICRGDDLFATGLVLVTPLAAEVQEEPSSGRARVMVVNALSRSGEKDVHVKVIGAAMSRFISGQTDLRGVFVADEVQGSATAIARDPHGRLAFHRGARPSLEDREEKEKVGQEVRNRGKADYRFQLQLDNEAIQQSNQAILKGLYKQQQKGVTVQSAE